MVCSFLLRMFFFDYKVINYSFNCISCKDTLLDVRRARNGYIISSNYETEYEFGRGKRKKIKRQFSSDKSFSTNVTKKRLKNISTSDDSDFDGDNDATQNF